MSSFHLLDPPPAERDPNDPETSHLAPGFSPMNSLARIALTLAFIRTKNLWVAAGAHIINDWTFITISVISAGAIAAS